MLMLSAVTDVPEPAWGVLVSEGHTLMENRGKRDTEDLAGLLSNNGLTLLPRPGDAEPLERVMNLGENRISTRFSPDGPVLSGLRFPHS